MNRLYTIKTFGMSESKDRISAHILLVKEHPLFEGHFPGNPILPGVCTVQIIKELLERGLGKELFLTHANTIKYLGFITPATTFAIQFELMLTNTESGSIVCNAVVSAEGNTLCSLKGEFANVLI
jgi:3-hydroxyacyl-[acyl-carrier-protein] dehydratase